MPTAMAMCTRIRVADGKNTTTAVGTAYRTPDRHSRSTPNSRRASGVISAPLLPLGAREAGAAALAALIFDSGARSGGNFGGGGGWDRGNFGGFGGGGRSWGGGGFGGFGGGFGGFRGGFRR